MSILNLLGKKKKPNILKILAKLLPKQLVRAHSTMQQGKGAERKTEERDWEA